MLTKCSIFVAFVCTALTLNANLAQGVEPSGTITIMVEGMHCAGCALKVSGKLKKVQGVANAEADGEKGSAVVTSQPTAAPSPRALWEAIEKAGYKPTKLVSPVGTFTKKPKS